jgi:teichuronic acid biosynthesis glycosyltransferase TuaC
MVPNVLVLSRNFPNPVLPFLGLWVEGLVRHTQQYCDLRVVSPVPYSPPLPKHLGHYGQYRGVPRWRTHNGIEVFHPRFLLGPGYSFHRFESQTYYWGAAQQVESLWRQTPFDLIHAHCIYPDGVVAVQLGQRYRVPVVITEHALWHPWLDNYSSVRRRAVWAAKTCAAHIMASQGLKDSVVRFTGQSQQMRSIPIGVDVSVFRPPSCESLRQPDQILYVGRIKFSKGVDYLLKSMHQLVKIQPNIKLLLVGGSLWGYESSEERKLRSLTKTLQLEKSVEFLGARPPAEVATLMQTSTLLVLPSLRESFGAVLVEALACGTPVVSTDCGGPKDIINESVGILVPKQDEKALADAIVYVLHHRHQYEPERLRAYAIQHYSWERVAKQTVNLYQEVLD